MAKSSAKFKGPSPSGVRDKNHIVCRHDIYRNKRDPDKSELLIKTGTVGGLVTGKYSQLSFPKLQCFDFQNIFLQLCMCYLFEKNQLKRTGIF